MGGEELTTIIQRGRAQVVMIEILKKNDLRNRAVFPRKESD